MVNNHYGYVHTLYVLLHLSSSHIMIFYHITLRNQHVFSFICYRHVEMTVELNYQRENYLPFGLQSIFE